MTELTQYVYAFDKANEPIARAKDGDEFSFRTLDCYSGRVGTRKVERFTDNVFFRANLAGIAIQDRKSVV